ncbi:MAG: hypothetical protein Q8M31_09145 [Beijerinckiaceae bacterium]|nr:hypothetical protein [Beijerinckiaceae bacterium]
MAIVTIVTPASTAAIGSLDAFDHVNHARRLRHLFRDVPYEWGLFVTDFSENEHRTGRYEPFWCIHFHGLLVGGDVEVIRRVLANRCLRTDAIPRPYFVERWDRDVKALRYLLGLDFDRRIGRDDGSRFNPKTGKRRVCRDVRHDPLRVAQRVELLLHLHAIGVESRITMLRAQLRRTDDGLIVVPMRQSAS